MKSSLRGRWFGAAGRFAKSKSAGFILLFTVYFLVSSAAFNGFYDKWGFNDGMPKWGIEGVLNEDGYRPFVYRQLLPDIARAVDRAITPKLDAKLRPKMYNDGELRTKVIRSVWQPGGYFWRYHVVYYLTFLSILAGCFALRWALMQIEIGKVRATVAPAIFMLLVPIIQTNTGQFYDYPEILFMALAAGCALSGGWAWILPISVLATWNKEAFLFFIATLYPLLRTRLGRMASGGVVLGAMFVSGVTYLVVRGRYVGNPGGAIEYHLQDAVRIYSSLAEWLRTEINYGIPTPKGFSIPAFAILALLVARCWGDLSRTMRNHALVALAINLPLFIVLCYPRELRNMSMLYFTLAALIAFAIPKSDAGSSLQADQRDSADD
jgi:hypothetical protein